MTTELSYAHGASDRPLLGETIGQNLRRTVEQFGEREALVVRHQNVRLTYSALWALTTRCARGLLAHGVQQGDRVGIWAPNRFEWVVLQFAAARVGAILVNVNPAYRTAELEYALRQSGVSLLVLARRFRQTDYVAMLAEVRGACPDLRETLVLEDDWSTLLASGDSVSDAELAKREDALEFDQPIDIPVHVRHDWRTERRHAVASQHSQQRVLRGRADRPRCTAFRPCSSCSSIIRASMSSS